MDEVEIKITDNSGLAGDALKRAIARGLEAIGLEAEDHAKENLTNSDHVDTGLLRNSITFAIGGKSAHIRSYKADRGDKNGSYSGTMPKENEPYVAIGSNVEYAQIIENGSSKIAASYYLRRAATEHSSEYKKLMEESLKNG